MPVRERSLNIGLAELLKTETRAVHSAAERSVFLAELLSGRMDRPAYCAFLRNLHAIYTVLEQSLERHAHHPMIVPIFSRRCGAPAHSSTTCAPCTEQPGLTSWRCCPRRRPMSAGCAISMRSSPVCWWRMRTCDTLVT